MIKIKKDIMGWESPIVVHPGEFLKEVLSEYNISQAELAERTGLASKTINEIIKGKCALTRETAYKLEKIFSMSAQYWINLQHIFDDDIIRIEEKEKTEEEVSKYLPKFRETYKELCHLSPHFGISGLNWTDKNFSNITIELQKFFGTASLGYIDQKINSVVFRKYTRNKTNLYSLSAWLRIGEIKAYSVNIPDFDNKKLRSKLLELKQLSKLKPEIYLPEIENILSECGVVVSYLPQFKNTHIQGASKWVGPKKVLLMLNTQNKDEGRFWFNLFHEIGHILNHSKKECFIDIDETNSSDIEKEADDFAQKILIADFDFSLKEFNLELSKTNNFDDTMKTIAERNDISIPILAGRFTHHYKDNKQINIYLLMSKFLKVKINHTNILI